MANVKRDDHGGLERDGATADTVVEPGRGIGGTQPAWPRYRSWLEQPAVPVPNRHAAITRSLYSWANYKSWAEKVRSDWEKED
ncbi:MAG TPA: hypothetical protein VLT59_00010 [Steroidobacteraceae bacterium]|nr:hypothetical protein [Steroidobacteraceae bacterium]